MCHRCLKHLQVSNRTGTDRLLDAAAMPNCANPARFRERSLVGSGSYSVTPHRQIGALKMVAVPKRDPRHHVRKMQRALREIRDHLREDITKVDDPKLKAMFEKTAEV